MSSTEIKNRLLEKTELYYLFFLLFGYIVSSALPTLLNVSESRGIAVPYRIFVFTLSILIILNNRTKAVFKKYYVIAFCFFCIFYFFKMSYSFQYDNYFAAILNRKLEFLSRIPLIIFFPTLALFFIDLKKINFPILLKISFWSLFVILSINFLFIVFVSKNFNRTNGIFSVYYITSGHFGLTLIIISSYFLFFKKSVFQLVRPVFLYLGILVGGFSIFVSAARSPLLAFFAVLFYFLLLKRKGKNIILFFAGLLVFIVMLYLLKNYTILQSDFIDRNYVFIFEGNISGREYFLNRGFQLFLNNPLFGSRVLYEDGMYPHNIFVDVLMSGGIFLFVFFAVFFTPIFKNCLSFFVFRKEYAMQFLFFLFFIQYFLLALTSYNIVSSPDFWYFSALIINFSISNNDKT